MLYLFIESHFYLYLSFTLQYHRQKYRIESMETTMVKILFLMVNVVMISISLVIKCKNPKGRKENCFSRRGKRFSKIAINLFLIRSTPTKLNNYFNISLRVLFNYLSTELCLTTCSVDSFSNEQVIPVRLFMAFSS